MGVAPRASRAYSSHDVREGRRPSEDGSSCGGCPSCTGIMGTDCVRGSGSRRAPGAGAVDRRPDLNGDTAPWPARVWNCASRCGWPSEVDLGGTAAARPDGEIGVGTAIAGTTSAAATGAAHARLPAFLLAEGVGERWAATACGEDEFAAPPPLGSSVSAPPRRATVTFFGAGSRGRPDSSSLEALFLALLSGEVGGTRLADGSRLAGGAILAVGAGHAVDVGACACGANSRVGLPGGAV